MTIHRSRLNSFSPSWKANTLPNSRKKRIFTEPPCFRPSKIEILALPPRALEELIFDVVWYTISYSEGYDVLFHPKFHTTKSRYVGTYLILVLDPTYVVFLRGTLISFPVPSPCSFEVITFASHNGARGGWLTPLHSGARSKRGYLI